MTLQDGSQLTPTVGTEVPEPAVEAPPQEVTVPAPAQ